MQKSHDVLVYQGFIIDILVKKGFAGRDWYFFHISGNGLSKEIESDSGEETEGWAVREAMEFIDEHLAYG